MIMVLALLLGNSLKNLFSNWKAFIQINMTALINTTLIHTLFRKVLFWKQLNLVLHGCGNVVIYLPVLTGTQSKTDVDHTLPGKHVATGLPTLLNPCAQVSVQLLPGYTLPLKQFCELNEP